MSDELNTEKPNLTTEALRHREFLLGFVSFVAFVVFVVKRFRAFAP